MLHPIERPAAKSAILDEILANHFRAVVEEMSTIVLRAAHTTFIKETQDYAAALVTPEGEMFAYPHSTGVTALLGIPMRNGVEAFDDWAPGDIMIANDPYLTQGMVMHLPDFYLLKPIFQDGRLQCFAWAFMHCSDVGGAVPGSTDMKSHEIFQEGLRIRPVRLYREGQLNSGVWNLIADNCRIPALNWGDVGALVAALNTGERRMQRLSEKFGAGAVEAAMRTTIDRTEERTRAVLRGIPEGEYRFVDYLEDDFISDVPVRIEVALRARGDGTVVLDYTGSDPQVRAALNLPTGGQKHHPFLCLALTNFVATRAEGLHLNSGILRCIDLVLPENSIVNAAFPAACGMRYLATMRAHDAVLGALAQAVPGQAPAAGAGEIAITLLSTLDLGSGRLRVAVANPVQGGSGGGPALDGVSGIDYPVAYLRNVPAEVMESEMPILVHRFGLMPDSEGAGRYRGGFGVEYRFSVDHPEATVVMRGKERYRFQPWGVAGGKAGSLGGTTVTSAEGRARDIAKTAVHRPAPGEVMSIRGAGGGGYGDPFTREPEAVARDVRDGLVSAARARDVYGVAIVDGKVDQSATAALRQRRRLRRAFDLGAGRGAWQRRDGALADAIGEWLARIPPRLRPACKTAAWAALAGRPRKELDAAAIGDTLAAIAERLNDRKGA